MSAAEGAWPDAEPGRRRFDAVLSEGDNQRPGVGRAQRRGQIDRQRLIGGRRHGGRNRRDLRILAENGGVKNCGGPGNGAEITSGAGSRTVCG